MNFRKIAFLVVSVTAMVLLLAVGVFGEPLQKDGIYRYLSTFTEVFSLVRSNYVEAVPSDQLVDGAFKGVTDAIDEFSFYVPPADMPRFRTFVDNDLRNVGLVATKRFGFAYVIAPIPGSPADEAGIETGDFIEKINGQPTQPMAVWQIRQGLQVQPGSTLKLTIIHAGMSNRSEVEVHAKSYIPTPPSLTMYGNVAYIRIPYFTRETPAQVTKLLVDVNANGKKQLIVDVRGNASAEVDDAIATADELLSKGVITSLEGRRVDAKRWQADPAVGFSGDIEVLTDRSTADAAEVFTAALTGNGRAKSVGVTTFGKAIYQKVVALPSGGALDLTIGHYTSPDLKPIDSQGLRPDVNVDLAMLAIQKENGEEKAKQEDLILEKALGLFGESETVLDKAA
ncbi:MAG: S41 family peptidase [Thermoanaerobaculia bacterium]